MKKIFFKMAALMLLLSALEVTALNQMFTSWPESRWSAPGESVLNP